MTKDELVVFLQECIRSGETYRDKFKPVWDEVEQQIRCDPPDTWDRKEDWQTKIFIPLQAKKNEIAVSYLNKMVFGKRRFFDITGVERTDHEMAQHLTTLIDTLFEIGEFKRENNFVLEEAVGSPGTSFMKVMLREDGLLKFAWRTPYNSLIDPECGHDLSKSRFFIDVYKKDIAYIVKQSKKGGLYDNEANQIDAFLLEAQGEANAIAEKAGVAQDSAESMLIIKGIDGSTDVTIPDKYKSVDVHECRIRVPNAKGEYEWRICTLLNGKYLLRDDENPYQCLAVAGCRTKPRKYDYYGRGYLENGRGFQDLSNSMVNLGFDSAKISSMDIIVLDDTKVKDSTTIKYKPLAIWKMKDINGVKMQRQQMSAITDIIQGLQLIDQLDQDASGITRHAQGAPSVSGQGTSSETLGEYQLKLQAVDQRFLDQGRFIEVDYVIPLIKTIFRIITNPKLFDQNKVNLLIGTKEVDDVQQVLETDPMTGQPMPVMKVVGTKEIPKIIYEELVAKGEMAFNFKAIGITQFSERLETLEKLKEALTAALSNPTLTAMTKIDALWKKLWQVSEIDDYDEFIRTKEEVRELLDQQQSAMMPPGIPGGMPPGMPGGNPGMPPGQMPPAPMGMPMGG